MASIVNVMDRDQAGFSAAQREYFASADAERFHWTTGAAGFADTEDALLAPFLSVIREPCLEIGCGEGNNLVRLGHRAAWVWVDLSVRKLVFAAGAVPCARYVAADAGTLPFASGRYRTVFIRDLLHHVPDPSRVLGEAVRVLAPGGRLCLLEPNGRNPIVNLQTRVVPAEAAARRSGTDHIAALLGALPLTDINVWTQQPLPLRRMVLHYRFGVPALGRVAAVRRGLAALEGILGRVVPPSRWAYVAAVARRPEAGEAVA